MTHSYSNIPAFSRNQSGSNGLPTSEYKHLTDVIARVSRIDYISRRKTKQEHIELANAQRSHKVFKKNPYFREHRDELIREILKGSPNFGGLKLSITKRGV